MNLLSNPLKPPKTKIKQAPQTSYLQSQAATTGATGTSGFGFNLPTLDRERYDEQQWLDIQAKLANPRTLFEGLLLAGYSPGEVTAIIESSGLYSQVTGGMPTQGYEQQASVVQGTSPYGYRGQDRERFVDPQTGKQFMYLAVNPGGLIGWYGMANPMDFAPDASDGPYSVIPAASFDFLSGGHQVDPRQMLNWLQTNSPEAELIKAMAAFSGQDPDQFMGQFLAALPRGSQAPLTRMI